MANKAGLQLKKIRNLSSNKLKQMHDSTLSKIQIKTQKINKHSWKIQLCISSSEIRCPGVDKMAKKFQHYCIKLSLVSPKI